MTKQKNKFWTFIFSLVPGCGQMYLGFMKRGITLLVLFMTLFVVPYLLIIEELSFFAFVVWCYAFFDSLNLNSCSPEAFAQLHDDFLLPSGSITKLKPNYSAKVWHWTGIVLIVLGISTIFNHLFEYLYYNFYEYNIFLLNALNIFSRYLPRILISVAFIVIGFSLIKRKKSETISQDAHEIQEVIDEK